MATFKPRAGILAAALFGTACASSDGLKGLPRCEKVTLEAHPDWRDVEYSGFRFRLPPCFRDEGRIEGAPHGGNIWRCGAISAEVVWGMWGQGSFGERRLCRTVVAGIPAMVGRPKDQAVTGVLVWYLTGELHQPILSVHGQTPADLSLATQIAYSGRK